MDNHTGPSGLVAWIAFAKVDATANNKLQRQYKVSSYPTVKYITPTTNETVQSADGGQWGECES